MLGSIKRGSGNLTQEAYQIIKDKIISGELAPGEFISISAMAKNLGISRTPVTNACQKLENDKFLTIAPKQGVIINVLTIDDAREIYELRAAIETYSARNSFNEFTADDIELLKVSCRKQKKIIESGNTIEFMKEDTAFHQYLLQKYENSHFFSILNTMFDRAYLIGLKSCKDRERMVSSLQEHELIVRCLEHKDKYGFVNALEENILNGYKNLMLN